MRKEITFLEESIVKICVVGVIASLSLLSAIGAIFLKYDFHHINDTNFIVAYFFLAPPLITIPVLFIMASHRKDLHRCGTYIQVFYEEKAGINDWGWESRLEKFRKLCKEESLDHLPWIFWGIFVLSIIFYYYILSVTEKLCILNAVAPLIVVIIQSIAHKYYHASSLTTRDRYYEYWLKIKKGLGNENK